MTTRKLQCELLADVFPSIVSKFEEKVLTKFCTVDTCTKEAQAFSVCSAIDDAIKILVRERGCASKLYVQPTVFNLIKDVCKIVPSPFGNSCSNFLDMFLPTIEKVFRDLGTIKRRLQSLTSILNDIKNLLKCKSQEVAAPTGTYGLKMRCV